MIVQTRSLETIDSSRDGLAGLEFDHILDQPICEPRKNLLTLITDNGGMMS